MTAAAYQYRDNSLYIRSSRGYNTDNLVKPDFAAPGVERTYPWQELWEDMGLRQEQALRQHRQPELRRFFSNGLLSVETNRSFLGTV